MDKKRKTSIGILKARPTIEGAGVRLHRGFANAEIPRFDPFLLFDDFSSDNAADFLPGFPWHPHRGIETVTYILDGAVRHGDSMGNKGVIAGGDVQWMTAGSGIIHEEMPEDKGKLRGFQLWVNLPKKDKMMQPRYQDVRTNEIPETNMNGTKIRAIAGKAGDINGPVEDIMASPIYLDVVLRPESEFAYSVPEGHTTFVYIFEGALGVGPDAYIKEGPGAILHFSREGSEILLRSGSAGARFLLVAGKPLGEPIAWGGPIVMNTPEELKSAFTELQDGTFIRHK